MATPGVGTYLLVRSGTNNPPGTGSMSATQLGFSIADEGAIGGQDASTALRRADIKAMLAGSFVVIPADDRGDFLISSNLTIASPILPVGGSSLKPDNGVTVILQSFAQVPGPRKWIDTSLGGSVRFAGGGFDFLPEWFGATNDGATNDRTALLACATAAAASTGMQDADGRKWPVMRLSPGKGYAIASTLTIPVGVGIEQHAPIFYTGNTNEPALVIGDVAAQNIACHTGLNVVRRTQSTWLGEVERQEENVGIRIYNPVRAKIEVFNVSGFTVGCQPYAGDGIMLGFNEFRMGLILNCKFPLDFMNATVNGAINDNLVIGGYYTQNTGVNVGISRYGISFRTKTGAYYSNNNVIHKPCIEIFTTQAAPGVAVPILMETGLNNHIYDMRDEGDNPYLMVCTNDSDLNTILGGYTDSVTIQQSGTMAGNSVVGSGTRHYAQYTKPIAEFNLRDRINQYHTSFCQIIGMSIISSGDALFYRALDGLRMVGDAVEIAATSGVGVLLDTNRAKKFVLHRGVPAGLNGGRVFVRCYDANMTVLDNVGAAHPYVRGATGIGFSYIGTYGKGYSTGGDSTASVFFELKDEVKFAWVGVIAGTAVATVNSISITSDPNVTESVGVTTGLTFRNDKRYAHVVPNRGPSDTTSWPVGTEQWSTVPAAGGSPGWVNVFQKDTTVRVAHLGGAGNLEVASAVNMIAGDVIGVVLNNGSTHWTTISVVVDADTVTLTANMPSAAAVGRAVLTFRYKAMANLAA